MARPPLVSAEKKTLIVVSILRGEVTMVEASRREGVSQTSIAKWRDRFLAGGQAALSAGSHGTSRRYSGTSKRTSGFGDSRTEDSTPHQVSGDSCAPSTTCSRSTGNDSQPPKPGTRIGATTQTRRKPPLGGHLCDSPRHKGFSLSRRMLDHAGIAPRPHCVHASGAPELVEAVRSGLVETVEEVPVCVEWS